MRKLDPNGGSRNAGVTRSIPASRTYGFPNLPLIQDSIHLLYRSLPRSVISSFAESFPPTEAYIPEDKDITVGVQTLAAAIARHLNLPRGSIIVNFREIDCPGRVELTPDQDYIVELRSKYRTDHRDIPAILAHEVTHVFLHKHGVSKTDTFENEVLTDTAAVYLGVGWLLLDAFRLTERRSERYQGPRNREVRVETLERRLGYLTPDEYGYVFSKRSEAFRERPRGFIGSPAGKSALARGRWQALQDYRSPPLATCGYWNRVRYIVDRGLFDLSNSSERNRRRYRFERSDTVNVILECPVCHQKLRLPTKRRLNVRCVNCGIGFECRT